MPGFGKMTITASNDLNEETLDALNKQVIIHFKYSLSTGLQNSEPQEILVSDVPKVYDVLAYR